MVTTKSLSQNDHNKADKSGRPIFVKFGIFVLILAALIAWRWHSNNVAAQALNGAGGGQGHGAVSVSVAPATVRDIVHTFSTTANIESPQNVKISPRISGQIIELAVKEGDTIKRGQVLARLDPTVLAATVRKEGALLGGSRARLLQAQATQNPVNVAVGTQIEQNQATLNSAKNQLNTATQSYAQEVAAADAAVADAQGRVASADAAIANAQAALQSAQANEANASTSLERQTSLFSQGAVAKQDVDNARTQAAVQSGSVGVAQAQVNAAKAGRASADSQLNAARQQAILARSKGKTDIRVAHTAVIQATAQLKNANANTSQKQAYQANLAALQADVASVQADLVNAQAQLAETTLRSPIDGFVSSRLADPGTLATPGQPILNLQALSQVWVNVPIPEEQIQHVAIGQTATVTVDGIPGRTFIARLFQINPSGDPASRNFTVRLTLDNRGGEIKPGMFARVTLITDQVHGATVVPLEAIQTDPDGSFVWVMSPKMTVTRTPVTTGASDDQGTAILTGVSPGDQVVTAGAQRLKDGAKVAIGGVGPSGGKGGHGGHHKHSAA